MSPRRAYSIYVRHILEAAERAQRYVVGMSFQDFVEDERTVDATVRTLEIIGEATKRLPKEVRVMDAQIPWNRMAGMRDVIVHQYDDVDLPVVWDTLQVRLPAVLPRLRELHAQLEQTEDEEWGAT